MIVIVAVLTIAIGFYMAWNIGANDAANSMATSYGSGALTLKQIIIIASILEFTGAVLYGKKVTHTIAKGIVPIDSLAPHIVALGALAAILSASIWITIATYYHLPVSTTHSIVGAMVGFGIASVSQNYLTIGDIKWDVLYRIVMSWILSPIVGAILAFLLFTIIKITIIDRYNVNRVERVFRYLQILTASYMAFAHGSNDVANATGPMTAALRFLGNEAPTWVLLIGGIGIAVGIATWGWRVIETVGNRITELTPSRGFSAEFATATTVLFASSVGMPISTTHTLVGSVIGVGLAGGLASVDLTILKRIIASWLLTVPVAAGITMAVYTMMVVFA